jgi:hypothetical protein
VRPAEDILYAPGVAERIARDVDGYPYFIQWFGEALWDAADPKDKPTITARLYEQERPTIQQSVGEEFFRAPLSRRTPGRPGNAASRRLTRLRSCIGCWPRT